MLTNAMLLRIDDPPPAPSGPAIAVRCSMGLPSGAESATIVAMGINAAAVLYLAMADAARVGSPAEGQQVLVQLDGCPVETWRVVCAADRVSDVLSHVQLFLEPV
jgi:hypothetical protein